MAPDGSRDPEQPCWSVETALPLDVQMVPPAATWATSEALAATGPTDSSPLNPPVAPPAATATKMDPTAPATNSG